MGCLKISAKIQCRFKINLTSRGTKSNVMSEQAKQDVACTPLLYVDQYKKNTSFSIVSRSVAHLVDKEWREKAVTSYMTTFGKGHIMQIGQIELFFRHSRSSTKPCRS